MIYLFVNNRFAPAQAVPDARTMQKKTRFGGLPKRVFRVTNGG
jgi:hypothetical protein